MTYELKSEQFSGPIEKLLELIEIKKLDVSELNLAEVTADFLNYINVLKEKGDSCVTMRLLADFIVVASRLILIKSKILLPGLELTEEEEASIKDLEGRLVFYQRFKPAIKIFESVWEKNQFSISRLLFSGRPTVFYPSNNFNIGKLNNAISAIIKELEQFKPEIQTIKSSLISLEEKIEEIIKRVESIELNSVDFRNLTKQKPKSEIIVMFLAILHLLARQIINVEQNKCFSDIIIKKNATK